VRTTHTTVRSVLPRWTPIISLTLAVAFAAVEVAAGPFVLTLNVTSVDAAGRQLVGPFGETPRVVLRALNVTRECRDFVCAFNETLSFVNSTSILVNVSIYWLGVLVYEKSLSVENGTRTNLMAKINASTIRLVLTNDGGRALERCTARVVGLKPKTPALTVASGQAVSLPFGDYNASSAECKVEWASDPLAVPVLDPLFRVSNGTPSVSLRLGVAGAYKVELRRADGSPLVGARVKIVYVGARNFTVFDGTANLGYVTLSDLPYGRYLIAVSWQGETLLNSIVEVNGLQKGVNLTTNLLPAVTLAVLDADSRPVAGARLRIARVGGGSAAFDAVSDLRGQVVLSNVVPGGYVVSASWRNYTFSVPVQVSGSAVEVKLPLRKVKVRVVTEPACAGSCSLPPGLSAELAYGGDVLASASLARASAELVLEPSELVYVAAPLKLRVFWNGSEIFERDLSAEASVLSFALPFYNISLRVVDASGRPLPNASLKVADELGAKAARTDLQGVAEVGFVYGRKVRVEAFWMGVPVAKEVVAVAPEPVEVKASVYTVKVEVVNALGQPVAGALLTATVNGSGYSFELRAQTRDDGAAELRLPVPPGAQVTLEVRKGRVRLVRQLLTEEVNRGATRVALDLLIDLGPLQLRAGEFAALVAAAVAAALAVALALKVWGGRMAARGVFEEYGGRAGVEEESEEETSWKGFLERFREVFGSEKVEEGGEEEEGEGFFDEF
jgi:hypothetical protein